MDILYIAFACNPYVGSEAYCGWSWIMNMRALVNVSVVTRKENQKDIDDFCRENNINDVKFYYFDIPPNCNFYYKKKKAYMLYYVLWQYCVRKDVDMLMKENSYDYVHLVTLGDFRFVFPLKSCTAKVVLGPVGGAQTTPHVFFDYVKENWFSEWFRVLVNKSLKLNLFYRKYLNKCQLVIAANKETMSALSELMRYPERCVLLTENGVLKENIKKEKMVNASQKVVFLWAGRVVYRKGLEFLMDVIPHLKNKDRFELRIVGDGPQISKLQNLCKDYDIKEYVKFIGKLSYDEMKTEYMQADVFVFPSLRETTGTVIFEAMCNAVPIITFNQNGADLIVDDCCGIKVDINQNLEQIKVDFAMAMDNLIVDPCLREKMGNCAREKMESEYVWEHKCRKFYNNYLKK